jgi:chromosome segregation ATPase
MSVTDYQILLEKYEQLQKHFDRLQGDVDANARRGSAGARRISLVLKDATGLIATFGENGDRSPSLCSHVTGTLHLCSNALFLLVCIDVDNENDEDFSLQLSAMESLASQHQQVVSDYENQIEDMKRERDKLIKGFENHVHALKTEQQKVVADYQLQVSDLNKVIEYYKTEHDASQTIHNTPPEFPGSPRVGDMSGMNEDDTNSLTVQYALLQSKHQQALSNLKELSLRQSTLSSQMESLTAQNKLLFSLVSEGAGSDKNSSENFEALSLEHDALLTEHLKLTSSHATMSTQCEDLRSMHLELSSKCDSLLSQNQALSLEREAWFSEHHNFSSVPLHVRLVGSEASKEKESQVEADGASEQRVAALEKKLALSAETERASSLHCDSLMLQIKALLVERQLLISNREGLSHENKRLNLELLTLSKVKITDVQVVEPEPPCRTEELSRLHVQENIRLLSELISEVEQHLLKMADVNRGDFLSRINLLELRASAEAELEMLKIALASDDLDSALCNHTSVRAELEASLSSFAGVLEGPVRHECEIDKPVQVSVKLAGNLSDFTDDKRRQFLEDFARELGISSKDVDIADLKQGSIIVEMNVRADPAKLAVGMSGLESKSLGGFACLEATAPIVENKDQNQPVPTEHLSVELTAFHDVTVQLRESSLENDSLKSQQGVLDSRLKQLISQLDAVTLLHNQSLEEKKELNLCINSLKSELAIIQADLHQVASAARTEKAVFILEAESAASNIASLKYEVDRLDSELAMLVNEVEELESLKHAAENSLKSSDMSKGLLLQVNENRLNALMDQLNLARRENAQIAAELQETQQNSKVLNEELILLREEELKLAQNNLSLTDNFTTFRYQHDVLRSEHELAQANIAKLTQEHRIIVEQHSVLSMEHASLSAQHQAVCAEHEALSGQHQSLIEERNSLGVEFQGLALKHQMLSAEHSDLSSQHCRLTSSHAAATSALFELTSSHEKLAAERQLLGEEHSVLSMEHASLSAQHQAVCAEHEALSGQHQSLIEERNSLGVEFKCSTLVHRQLNFQYSHLTTQLEALSAQHQALVSQHEAQSTRCELQTLRHENLLSRFETKSSEFVETMAQLKDISCRYAAICTEHAGAKLLLETMTSEKAGLIEQLRAANEQIQALEIRADGYLTQYKTALESLSESRLRFKQQKLSYSALAAQYNQTCAVVEAMRIEIQETCLSLERDSKSTSQSLSQATLSIPDSLNDTDAELATLETKIKHLDRLQSVSCVVKVEGSLSDFTIRKQRKFISEFAHRIQIATESVRITRLRKGIRVFLTIKIDRDVFCSAENTLKSGRDRRFQSNSSPLKNVDACQEIISRIETLQNKSLAGYKCLDANVLDEDIEQEADKLISQLVMGSSPFPLREFDSIATSLGPQVIDVKLLDDIHASNDDMSPQALDRDLDELAMSMQGLRISVEILTTLRVQLGQKLTDYVASESIRERAKETVMAENERISQEFANLRAAKFSADQDVQDVHVAYTLLEKQLIVAQDHVTTLKSLVVQLNTMNNERHTLSESSRSIFTTPSTSPSKFRLNKKNSVKPTTTVYELKEKGRHVSENQDLSFTVADLEEMANLLKEMIQKDEIALGKQRKLTQEAMSRLASEQLRATEQNILVEGLEFQTNQEGWLELGLNLQREDQEIVLNPNDVHKERSNVVEEYGPAARENLKSLTALELQRENGLRVELATRYEVLSNERARLLKSVVLHQEKLALNHKEANPNYIIEKAVQILDKLVCSVGMVVRSATHACGVVIDRVVLDGPAMCAGLRPGFLIERVNGVETFQSAQLSAILKANSPGEVLHCQVNIGSKVRWVALIAHCAEVDADTLVALRRMASGEVWEGDLQTIQNVKQKLQSFGPTVLEPPKKWLEIDAKSNLQDALSSSIDSTAIEIGEEGTGAALELVKGNDNNNLKEQELALFSAQQTLLQGKAKNMALYKRLQTALELQRSRVTAVRVESKVRLQHLACSKDRLLELLVKYQDRVARDLGPRIVKHRSYMMAEGAKMLDSLVKDSRMIGFRVQDSVQEAVRQSTISNVVVTEVISGGDAHLVGIAVGDIVESVSGNIRFYKLLNAGYIFMVRSSHSLFNIFENAPLTN